MNLNQIKFNILGIKLHPLDKYQVLEIIEEFFEKKSSSLICTVNAEFIMRAQSDETFFNVLNHKSSLNIIDGAGVIWARHLLKSWKPNIAVLKEVYVVVQFILSVILYPVLIYFYSKSIPKISGSDFVWDICRWASDSNKSVFILGNKHGLDENAVQKASLELQTQIFDLKVVGTHSGTPNIDDEKTTVEMIKKSGADILFCAFGFPYQEIWLAKNLGRSGCKIGMGLGATFDFIAGTQKRAPKFISAIGLEWLFRLLSRPNRATRQLSLPRFAITILKQRLTQV